MFPEYYRKGTDFVKGSNVDVPEPFRIGKCGRKEKSPRSTSITDIFNQVLLWVNVLRFVNILTAWPAED